MKNKRQYPINRIEDCISQAKLLKRKTAIQPSVCQFFKNLARDETTGIMAYAIWRARSQILSALRRASDHKQSGANASRVSQARSCWHMESVAFGDLPR